MSKYYFRIIGCFSQGLAVGSKRNQRSYSSDQLVVRGFKHIRLVDKGWNAGVGRTGPTRREWGTGCRNEALLGLSLVSR